MSSCFNLFQPVLIPILYGYECSPLQEFDTNSVCNIFKNTNIQSITQQDMTIDNYCDWDKIPSGDLNYYSITSFMNGHHPHWEIICDPNNTDITSIQFMHDYALNGTLNTEFSWPPHLEELTLYATYQRMYIV